MVKLALIALGLLATGGVAYAAAASSAQTIALACSGTMHWKGTTVEGYGGAEPNPISMGLIVNITAGTVHGFRTDDLLGVPVTITGVNDMTIAFGGTGQVYGDKWSISGSINRVTDEVEAAQTETDRWETYLSTAYSLKCRPTQ